MESRLKRYIKLVLLLTTCTLLLTVLLVNWKTVGGGNQWDFRAQYFETKAYYMRLNPYNHDVLVDVNDSPYETMGGNYFPYHPLAFNFFRLFTLLPYSSAADVFMVFLFLTLTALIVLWKEYILDHVDVLLFPVFLAFSFNCTLVIGLECGNIAALEALFIWLALLAFIKNRPWLFLLAIASISFFKMFPLLLTPMVFLLPDKRKNLISFGTVMLVTALLWFSPMLYDPVLFQARSQMLKFYAFLDLGRINPCSMSLLIDLLQIVGQDQTLQRSIAYIIWLTVILGIYYLIIRKMDWEKERKELAFFTLLTYALAAPRFKHYAYLQLVPVAYYLFSRNPGLLVFDILRLLMPNVKLPFLLNEYHPMLALGVNWAYLGWIIVQQKNCGAQDAESKQPDSDPDAIETIS